MRAGAAAPSSPPLPGTVPRLCPLLCSTRLNGELQRDCGQVAPMERPTQESRAETLHDRRNRSDLLVFVDENRLVNIVDRLCGFDILEFQGV